MASRVPFFRGENVVLKLYQSGKPVYLAAKNWNVEVNATEAADGVNGETRDRLDIIVNHYSASVDVFQSDMEVVNSIIAAQAAHDAQGLPLKQTGAVQIRMRDGTKASFLLKEVCAGPWSMTNSGRPDAVMLNLKMRFTKFDPVQSF